MKLDNRSINETAVMFSTVDFGVDGSTQLSEVFDTSQYTGYTILFAGFQLGGTQFDLEIQTSDSASSGFVTVGNQFLVGGAIPNPLDATSFDAAGAIIFTRGVIDSLRFVRVRFSSIPQGAQNVAMFAIMNAAMKIAPSELAVGTNIAQ